MTLEEMKSTIRKMSDDTWHKRNLDDACRPYADEVVFYRPPFSAMVGKQAVREDIEGTLAAFTDTKTTIQEMIAEGDTVMAHWTWKAVHTGDLHVMHIPATGKQVKVTGCSIYHFKGGRIVEHWEYDDVLGLMQQLGAIPTFG